MVKSQLKNPEFEVVTISQLMNARFIPIGSKIRLEFAGMCDDKVVDKLGEIVWTSKYKIDALELRNLGGISTAMILKLFKILERYGDWLKDLRIDTLNFDISMNFGDIIFSRITSLSVVNVSKETNQGEDMIVLSSIINKCKSLKTVYFSGVDVSGFSYLLTNPNIRVKIEDSFMVPNDFSMLDVPAGQSLQEIETTLARFVDEKVGICSRNVCRTVEKLDICAVPRYFGQSKLVCNLMEFTLHNKPSKIDRDVTKLVAINANMTTNDLIDLITGQTIFNRNVIDLSGDDDDDDDDDDVVEVVHVNKKMLCHSDAALL
jgi:hypothetical protein